MADFTVRVVLHDNATWQDYQNLAAHLAAIGVVDVIQGGDGRRYKMPPAEYTCSGVEDGETVRQAVQGAANRVGKRNSILVTKSAGRYWSGLEQV
jgi:hypothetical protein